MKRNSNISFSRKKIKNKNSTRVPKVYGVAGLSWFGFLNTRVCSSKQSQAIRSYMACSFLFSGLIRTVTRIFSSRTLDPPGVPDRFLCILDSGVATAAGVPVIVLGLISADQSSISKSILQLLISKRKQLRKKNIIIIITFPKSFSLSATYCVG